jgi:uncharacterized membrane protein YfcA
MLGDAILGAGVAFCLAILTTPVGVSGAVFLVPFQISVVHTPSPAVTPTNPTASDAGRSLSSPSQ